MIYVDEYGICDLEGLIHAVPIDPCDDPEHSHEAQNWRIGLVLYVGPGHVSALTYPTRALRDAAFERICLLMKHIARSRARLYADEETVSHEESDHGV